MAPLIDKSQKFRTHSYEAGKVTGEQAQLTRKLHSKTLETLMDEINYLQSLVARDDETALAPRERCGNAWHDYGMYWAFSSFISPAVGRCGASLPLRLITNRAADKERTMIRGAMLEHDHFHDNYAAIDGN
ncbi:hypothetical protein MMC21_006935 [Puttea exsequens]|nr:hypothetical protein [Puttea exsequens]